jgi:hypothetical protein
MNLASLESRVEGVKRILQEMTSYAPVIKRAKVQTYDSLYLAQFNPRSTNQPKEVLSEHDTPLVSRPSVAPKTPKLNLKLPSSSSLFSTKRLFDPSARDEAADKSNLVSPLFSSFANSQSLKAEFPGFSKALESSALWSGQETKIKPKGTPSFGRVKGLSSEDSN